MFGDQALENFEADGIVTGFIVRDQKHPSGVALIMVEQHGENMIAVASGANAFLSSPDVERAAACITGSSVLLLQLKIPIETVRFAASMGAAAGVNVRLNPAPAQELDPELLKNVSILTPNEKETEMLTGVPPVDESSARRAAAILRDRGVENVMITLGESGAFVSTSEGSKRAPASSVKAVDTTAAGDAFNGALATLTAESSSLEEAVCYANRVAAVSVTRLGAQPSLPTRQEVEAGGISQLGNV
jgi:ribokinase